MHTLTARRVRIRSNRTSLGRLQRGHRVVAVDERGDDAHRVRQPLHRVRTRDRQPAHARTPDRVAEVDQAGRAAGAVDEDVVLVRVVVDHLLGQAGELRGDDALVPIQHPLDHAALVLGDVRDQPPRGRRLHQVPRMRSPGVRMVEADQRPVDARHEPPQRDEIALGVSLDLCPHTPVEPGQDPQHARLPGDRHPRRRLTTTSAHDPRRRVRRRRALEVEQHGFLQFDLRGIAGVEQLHHHAGPVGTLQPEVQITLAGERRELAFHGISLRQRGTAALAGDRGVGGHVHARIMASARARPSVVQAGSPSRSALICSARKREYKPALVQRRRPSARSRAGRCASTCCA